MCIDLASLGHCLCLWLVRSVNVIYNATDSSILEDWGNMKLLILSLKVQSLQFHPKLMQRSSFLISLKTCLSEACYAWIYGMPKLLAQFVGVESRMIFNSFKDWCGWLSSRISNTQSWSLSLACICKKCKMHPLLSLKQSLQC